MIVDLIKLFKKVEFGPMKVICRPLTLLLMEFKFLKVIRQKARLNSRQNDSSADGNDGLTITNSARMP